MSKIDDILSSSNASDALLGEQIDKLAKIINERAPSVVLNGLNNSGFEFTIDEINIIYEIKIFVVIGTGRLEWWNCYVTMIDSGDISANSYSKSPTIDDNIKLIFSATAAPRITVTWNNLSWVSYTVLKYKGAR